MGGGTLLRIIYETRLIIINTMHAVSCQFLSFVIISFIFCTFNLSAGWGKHTLWLSFFLLLGFEQLGNAFGCKVWVF